MRKRDFTFAKTRAQIRCAITAQQIRAFVLVSKIPNLHKSQISSFDCAGRIVSDLFGNPKGTALSQSVV